MCQSQEINAGKDTFHQWQNKKNDRAADRQATVEVKHNSIYYLQEFESGEKIKSIKWKAIHRTNSRINKSFFHRFQFRSSNLKGFLCVIHRLFERCGHLSMNWCRLKKLKSLLSWRLNDKKLMGRWESTYSCRKTTRGSEKLLNRIFCRWSIMVRSDHVEIKVQVC